MKIQTLTTDRSIRVAEEYLQSVDPILGELIAKQKLRPRKQRSDYFSSLCGSIVSQQVSVAAARAIYSRLEAAANMKPKNVLELSDEQIRTIGLSRQKTGYIRDLAVHFRDNPDVYNHLESQTDEQVIAELTDVKGIGVWTAQMFLISTLARPDVFAPDDIGLQRGMKQLYGWENVPPKKELERTADAWRPYRTVASWHLWHSLSNEPI